MDEAELIRAFRRGNATVSPIVRAAARDRLAAHIAENPPIAPPSKQPPKRRPTNQPASPRAVLVLERLVVPEQPSAHRRFKDEQEVYRHLGRLFQDLVEDDVLFPLLQQADTVVRVGLRNPTAQITLKMKLGETGQVDLGPTELVPEVVMIMGADLAHDFWLGKVNVTVALARRQIMAKGPVAKILKLLPVIEPSFHRYQALLDDNGRGDLAES